MTEAEDKEAGATKPARVQAALQTVADLCEHYQITALEDFLKSCRDFAQEETLNIAVLGRFKAGKSSFLNHLLGKNLLPIGIVPVTSVVTEVQWGPEERTSVQYAGGRIEHVPAGQLGEFVSEDKNPENAKRVERVCVELSSMDRYRGIRFVDTPGLESVFEHNTEASLEWLPNVGLALVAVGVDPPLSQHDIQLIRKLSRFTPNISLLLTKVDVLNEGERAQVLAFVQNQLARYWKQAVPVFPYSIRPGFEHLRAALDDALLSQVRAKAGDQREAILRHKVNFLLAECADYLNVALKAAEVTDTERDDLRTMVIGRKESLDDARLGLKLIVRHAIANTRLSFEELLRKDELPMRLRLKDSLNQQFPSWAASMSTATNRFEDWLQGNITSEITQLSQQRRNEFLEPLRRTSRQLEQSLQDFRNRLSDRLLKTLGVPLRTTEVELRVKEPASPDVLVGRIFDHNWELLSWLIPMSLVRSAVLKHFHRKIEYLVFANLSRLVAQWEETVNAALLSLEKESTRRFDGLVGTIETLIASAEKEAPQIRNDLARIEQARQDL